MEALNSQHVLEVLSRNMSALRSLGVRKIGLFGSVARGEGEADSDLDFIADIYPKSFDAYMDLRALLESLFQTGVDLVLLDNIKPRLRDRILAETVYAA